MTRRRVRFTATARKQLLHLQEWWNANSLRPEILPEDLEEATVLLSAFPGLGAAYSRSPIEAMAGG